MDFQKQDGRYQDERPQGDDATHLQDAQSAVAPAGRSVATEVILPDASGVVVLPVGIELSDIRVEGRDLVVVGADGVRYIIPEGAIIVPQLVVDGVAIPPLNLAALLTGNEPQPAAGNPQSSGGNFAGPVGPLQAAYGLGDLLPYTELNFPQPEEREIIPSLVDREPDGVVVTPDQPAGAIAATAQVDEAGLPARGGEPSGTDASAPSETTLGSILYNAPDGLASVTINGTPITTVGQTIAGAYGVLTVTSVAPGVIGYSYTLSDNVVGQPGPETFTVTVTDSDGDVANAALDISIVDDGPIAQDDADTVAAGTYGPELGNVLSGTGTTSGAAGADQQGADGATVTAVSGFGGSDTSFDGAGNLVVGGQYGTLTIKADGSYSYDRAPGTAGGVTDSFTYTLTDSDGTSDTAVLTITIEDSPAAVASLSGGATVDEAGLPARADGGAPGTEAPTDVETTSGAITVVAPDGVASVSIGDVAVTGAGQVITVPQGTFTITGYDPVAGTVTYTFTLSDNTAGDSSQISVPITVVDVDGDSDTKTLTIAIIDDHPMAVDDSATQPAEDAPVLVDVFANDIQGADNVQTGTVSAVPGSLSGAGSLVNNGDGTFTYTPAAGEEGNVTFDYSITDGDGDTSTATVTIALQDDSTPTIQVSGDNDVLEGGLPARGGEPAGSQAAGDGEFAAGAIAITTGGDTVASLVINSVDVTAGGTVTTGKGVLTVASDGAGGYTYSYQLTDNTLSDPDSDTFTLTITDSDGSTADTTLVVAIVDDAPSAADDAASLAAGTYGPIGGNVLANDTQGADGAGVTSYAGTGAPVTAGGIANGAYGTLTIAADGTFSYTRNPGAPGGVTDTFTYTITDGDGDPATATLTITVPDSDTSLDVPTAGEAGTSVLEEALATGSNPSSPGEATSGTIGFTAPDGPAILTIDGVPVTVGAAVTGAFGTLVIDAIGANTISYTYTLTTNTSGDNTADSFTVRVEDQDGDSTESDLVVAIVDDMPTALPDTDMVTEDGPLSASGNVITDAEANGDAGSDTQGADGAVITAFSGAGGAGVAGDTIVGAYGTLTLGADGSYTYALDNANPLVQGLDSSEGLTDTFAYTITDGDGDPSTSTLTITIAGADDDITIAGLILGGAELTFDEDDLALGSSPDPTMLTKSGTFEVVALDGIVTISIGGETIYSGGAFVPGQSITTAYGTLTFTGVSEDAVDASGDVTRATVSYSYALNANTLAHTGADDLSLTDSYTITVVDTDSTVANDTLDIQLIDDAPTAVDDSAAQVTENLPFEIDALFNDTFGADRVDTTDATKVFVSQDAAQGTVTYDPVSGKFTYTPDPAAGGASTSDSFEYTIIDRDGDVSTATVSVTLQPDSTPRGGSAAATVDDDGLGGNAASTAGDLDANAGDAPSDSSEASFTGTLDFDVFNDGPATITFAAAVDGATATVGVEDVEFHVVGNLLTAQITTGARAGTDLFEVEILDATTGEYQVRLLTNVLNAGGPNDEAIDATAGIDFVVTDSDLSTATSTLSITFDDDAPTAYDNIGTVTEGGSTGGNVLSDGTPDVFGADGGEILSISGAGKTVAPGVAIETPLGFLTIFSDGSYTYESKPNSAAADTTDTFTYTIVDGDGDTSTATLTLSIDDVSGNVFDTDVNVNEAGLDTITATGSNPGSDTEIGTGAITVSGAAGPFTYVLVGANSSGNGIYGTLALDPNDGTYTYTLDTPFTDAVNENSPNVVNGAESFSYEVYDSLNNLIGSGTIAVNITDDIPTAADEGLRTVAEDLVGTIDGNVLANDTEGADGASLTHVDLGGGMVSLTTGTALGGGVYSFTTANGTYTFSATGAWTFDPAAGLDQTNGPVDASFGYRLTDGDGDFDEASQPIEVTDGAGPLDPAPVDLTLDDQTLTDGSTPAVIQPPADSATITFLPGSDPFASIVFGDISGLGGGLTWVKAPDNLSVVGTQGGNPVVTLTLQVVGNQATVVATLDGNYLHANGGGDQDFDFGSVAVVATDIDGSFATADVSLHISDDLPTLAAGSPAANELTVDETQLGIDDSADFAGLFTPDFNADGAGSVSGYTLGIKAEGADTGLIDTLSGEKVVLHLDGATVVGWTQTSHLTVFEITISGSTVELDQQRAVKHFDTASDNEQSPALAADLITLTAMVTDADNDTATATANIGAAIRFLDDGPAAIDDTNTIGEDGATVSGSVLLGDDNTANTADDDKFGADGAASSPVTAVTGFAGAGTVGGTTTGEFGSLTLNGDGTYTYTVDTSKTQFLDDGESETDTFVYTIKDGDGDSDTATLTITITGSNDAPIARADTNWTVEDAAAPISGNVLASVDHTRLVAGDFADVADTDVDDAVTVQTPGTFNGAYGVLTIGVDGSYSYRLYTPAENPAAHNAVQALGIGDAALVDTFSYSAFDGTVAAPSTLSISIFGANDAPSLVASTAAVSDEGFANGIADMVGNPADTTNSTTFLTGDLNIADTDMSDVLSVSLGTPSGGLPLKVVDGTASGATLQWSVIDGGKTLVGYVTSTADPSVVIKVTDAGGYTVEILDPIFHPDTTSEDVISNLTIPVTVTDDSGSANASTTLSNGITVSFEDDSPIAFTPIASTRINTGTQIIADQVLDTNGNGIFDNSGGDGIRSITFASSIDGTKLTGSSGALQSGGQDIYLYIQPNGTLIASTDANPGDGLTAGLTVFTATLNAVTGTYSIDFDRTIDNGSGVNVGDFSAAAAGNTPWKGVDPDIFNGSTLDIASANDPNPDSTDLLFTPIGGGAQNTINSDSDDIGVGTGQTVNKPEALRIDLVQDLRRDAGLDESDPGGYLYDTHSGVSQFTFKMMQVSGNANQTATVRIVAYDVDDSANPASPAQTNVTDPTINHLVALDGATVVVKDASGTIVSSANYTVVDEGDTLIVSGLKTGWTVTFGADNDATFEAVEIQNAADVVKTAPSTLYGGNDFSLGGFAYSFTAIGAPVEFTLPVVLTDGDGDTSSGSISVTLDPVTPIVLDLDGDGVEFVGAAAGAVFDYNGDGNGVATAWAGHDDGILAIDANGDGAVNSGAEIVFGGAGLSDLEGLAAKYDTNRDGLLDSHDADFARFGVWQDVNGNGVSEAGEFTSLAALGITSIGLKGDGQGYTAANGEVTVAGSATYTRADGSTGSLADAAFATEARNAQRTAEVVTTAAVAAALADATSVAAAVPPATQNGHLDEMPVAEQTHVTIETVEPEASSARTAPSVEAFDNGDMPAVAARDLGQVDASDSRPALADLTERAAIGPDFSAADDAGPHATAPATASLFAGSGAEGVMQALMALAPEQASANGGGSPAESVLADALSDFAGAKLVDTIVDHFSGADTPAIALAANDTASALLVQLGGGAGMSAPFHDMMAVMADADAHAMVAAQT